MLGTDRHACHFVARRTQLGRGNASRRERLTRAFRVVGACAAIATTVAFAQSAPQGANTLQVRGNVERELALGISDLQGLAVQRVEDVRQIKMAGATDKVGEQKRSYTGVLLRDVLASAKPVEKHRHDLRRSIVVATATDGYQAVFSWAELFLSPIGDGALVVFERDGAPLPESEGPLALVSLRDTQPGPRHVKWLQKVDIRRVGD